MTYGYVSPSPYGPVGYGPGVGVGPVPSDVPGYEEGHPGVPPLTSGVPPGIFEDEVHLQRLQSRHPVVPGMASPLDDDQKSMRWRDPNLSEVIGFLSNPNNIIKANAAAYLQHLCYMDDPNKQKTRNLGGIPPLVQLLDHDNPDVYRNACGALRNLSYGRQNDENKRAIKNAGGVPALINLLRRTSDADVKELVTGVLWNLSSCEVSLTRESPPRDGPTTCFYKCRVYELSRNWMRQIVHPIVLCFPLGFTSFQTFTRIAIR